MVMCYVCLRQDHDTSACPQNYCTLCGWRGHRSFQCPGSPTGYYGPAYNGYGSAAPGYVGYSHIQHPGGYYTFGAPAPTTQYEGQVNRALGPNAVPFAPPYQPTPVDCRPTVTLNYGTNPGFPGYPSQFGSRADDQYAYPGNAFIPAQNPSSVDPRDSRQVNIGGSYGRNVQFHGYHPDFQQLNSPLNWPPQPPLTMVPGSSELDQRIVSSGDIDTKTIFTRRKAHFEKIMENTKSSILITPLRPEFASGNDSPAVFTNHFALTLPKGNLYHYKIEGLVTKQQREEKDIPPAYRRRELMAKAITQFTVLNQSQYSSSYATDGLENIVTWKALPRTDAARKDVVEAISIMMPTRQASQEANSRSLCLKYIGIVPMAKFCNACEGTINELPLQFSCAGVMSPVQAINTIIGHAAWMHQANGGVGAFQVNGNKFFGSDADNTFEISPGLVGRHGFFFTLRLSMGRPLLNISIAASAFYEDGQGIAHFMCTFRDKAPTDAWTDADVKYLKASLKGVRVFINHENRIATITDIAGFDETPSRVNLDDKGRPTTVAKYLRAKRGRLACFSERFPVNTIQGTFSTTTCFRASMHPLFRVSSLEQDRVLGIILLRP